VALDINALGGLPVTMQVAVVAAATFLQEDLAALAAGTALTEQKMALLPAILGVSMGVLGSNLGFWLTGRLLGPAAFRLPGLRSASKSGMVERARAQFDKSGFWAMFLSRFIPGTRIPACTLAGILGMSFPRFFLYSVAGIAPWTALMLWIPDRILAMISRGAGWWMGWIALALVGIFVLRKSLVTKESP
jgi:membrane protein DedA with SNARE-associated domain